MLEVALDAVARVHRDPADAAPRMMEVNTAAEARDGVDVSSWPRPAWRHGRRVGAGHSARRTRWTF
ncbi:hypothetical protein ACFW6V_08745 [Streptomyces sp. NPDC058734]|uniref:hypothetical protein n=1 Tax=Streptomyces sp. NPDC058734 TaxID=3346615 RepID=UPI0036942954